MQPLKNTQPTSTRSRLVGQWSAVVARSQKLEKQKNTRKCRTDDRGSSAANNGHCRGAEGISHGPPVGALGTLPPSYNSPGINK